VPEVNGVEVATQRRGRGIGRALIGAAARTALEHGHRQISLGVEPDNERALQLYERLGFTRSMPYVDRYSIVSEDGHRQDVADACVFLVASSEIVAGGLQSAPNAPAADLKREQQVRPRRPDSVQDPFHPATSRRCRSGGRSGSSPAGPGRAS
jgi:hypothetical protein